MSVFRNSDYKGKKDTSATKGHWSKKRGLRQISHWKSKTKFTYCPRVCQQRPNGTLGKKTFDGRKCSECGFTK